MNRAWILSSLLFTAATAAACSDGEPTSPDEEPPPVTDECADHVCRLVEDIQTSTTLEAENVYVIPRLKQLFVQPGATLTIEPAPRSAASRARSS